VGLAARALHSAIDSTTQEKIQELVATFQKLKEEFDSRVGARTLVTVAHTQVTVQTDSKFSDYDYRGDSQGFHCAEN
jgi:molybdopterin converting factor small subunit